MLKTVRIGQKDYDLKSSAYTMFGYKNHTGRELLKDVSKLNRLQGQADQFEALGELLEIAEQLAYVMYQENKANPRISFEAFLEDMDGILEDIGWINDVIALAMSTFRR